MASLEAHAIRKSYSAGGRQLVVLRDLDLAVESGEMVAIVGASGVGKSTLLHVLGGLDRVETGTIVIGEAVLTTLPDPAVVAFRNRHVGFVFQFHHLLPEFTAVENAEMPMRIARAPQAEARPLDGCCAGSGSTSACTIGPDVVRRGTTGGGRRALVMRRRCSGRRADRRPRRTDRCLAPRTAAGHAQSYHLTSVPRPTTAGAPVASCGCSKASWSHDIAGLQKGKGRRTSLPSCNLQS
jgi:ABC-type uncharacterized transport system YnjBCD ATPase subunit